MGRRARRRAGPEAPATPEVAYDGLVLRAVLSPASRRAYAELPAGDREDAWHRRVEFLWDKLAVRWEVEGVLWEGPRDVLARYRAASAEEKEWVRARLREHCADWFPELEAP